MQDMSINKKSQKETPYIKFYELFSPMMGSVKNLKKAGHTVSFITQFLALANIFGRETIQILRRVKVLFLRFQRVLD